MQQHHITMIMQENKGILNRLLRCYKCSSQHKLANDQMNQMRQMIKTRRVLPPVPQPPLLRGYKKCETCFKVTQKLDLIQNAGFECLNCNTLMCKSCLDIHFQYPANEAHRVLKLIDNGMYERTDNDFCATHRERLKYYCFNDEKPLCVVCANYEDHRDHLAKPIAEIVNEEEKIRVELQLKLGKLAEEVDKNLGFFQSAKDSIGKQKALYIEKLRKDFEVIYKQLEKKYSELY